MKSGIRTTKDNLKKLLKCLKQLPKMDVLVGIPEDKTDRNPELGDTTATNAMIGAIMENGEPAMNIPARAFLQPGVRSIKPVIVKYMEIAGKAAMEGDETRQLQAFHSLGLKAQAAVRKKITEGPFEPLADRTLYARKHRKIAPRQGEKPLIDTAQLRNAITYVVRGVE